MLFSSFINRISTNHRISITWMNLALISAIASRLESLLTHEFDLDFKQIGSRQEWITGIECINAIGVALPPMLIFKAKHTNSQWIPIGTPSDWRFSTSNSGWTSDSHGYQWLTTVFDPCSRPQNPTKRRLLIMDRHSSHITANVISYCMQNSIDLLILPPHTSQIT